LWAALIFGLSSLPGSRVPSFDLPGLDKVVHFFLYATLGFLVARALGRALTGPTPGLSFRLVALAAALAVVYGASDEFHQLFVAGRSAELADLCADAIGGLCGAIAAEWVRRRPLW
jgi:VanZ family protein